MRKILTGIVIMILVSTLLIGCNSKNPQSENPKPNGDEIQNIEPSPNEENVKITLYFADENATGVKPEIRKVSKQNETMEELVIKELIKGPESKDLYPTIPKETKLLSIEVADGIAYVNFSKELQTKHWGGSTGEMLTIDSVRKTLGELPGIKKVQFLVEGQKQESLLGHAYTMEPISVD